MFNTDLWINYLTPLSLLESLHFDPSLSVNDLNAADGFFDGVAEPNELHSFKIKV
jgi:hypothetical protein